MKLENRTIELTTPVFTEDAMENLKKYGKDPLSLEGLNEPYRSNPQIIEAINRMENEMWAAHTTAYVRVKTIIEGIEKDLEK